MLKFATPEQRLAAIAQLNDEEAYALLYDWELWGRPEQLTPPGNWQTWLILAGRGYGKTRTGAEGVRQWIKRYPIVNLIAATADDARDIMIEGESGILAICPNDERPDYKVSKRQLIWPNGAKSLIFTADEPERLRGKQHMKLWMDELASWRYTESYDQAMFGLRLGDNPQTIVTTTPRPTPLIKKLARDPNTFLTKGSTYDNRANLAATFYSHIIKTYENTRLGRQELNAEILEDNPNALWNQAQIDNLRVQKAPTTLIRIVVGVDPSVSDSETSNETGIIVAGLGSDQHGYVLDDASLNSTVNGWAKKVVEAYKKSNCDRVIGEVNNGGDLVEAVIRNEDKNISYKKVHASRGKAKRAEPISALYEQGRIHHVGCFPKLEDQMCGFDPINPDESESPDRMDALVWAFSELFDGAIQSQRTQIPFMAR